MPPDTSIRLDRLETEQVSARTADIDRMSPLEIVETINAEDATVALAVQLALPRIAEAIEGIAERMRRGGRLIYAGAGTSGRLGVLDASECPPTFNTPRGLVVGLIAGGNRALTESIEAAEDSQDAGRADVAALNVGEADTVVGIAASGRTPFVLGAVAEARERGALTVGVACTTGSPLADRVTILIAPVVGPEVITGSTRLKAGTAQKMVLNMLSTGTMILLGKTFGNLMVDMRPTNAKLRARAIRIVGLATGLDESEAAALLRDCDHEVKTAIVAALTGVDAVTARERLARAGGVVRTAIQEHA
ncbi:MAG: N-acetylmuramic acid 6-phosphate etherase [Thermomicrobiales bacterium]